MSMVITRSPLGPIGMNAPKRRSARLSAEGVEENEPPSKKAKVNGGQSQSISTKVEDGGSDISKKRTRKKVVYDQVSDGFVFTKSKRAKTTKEPAAQTSNKEASSRGDAKPAIPNESNAQAREEPAPQTTKTPRRRLPTTPERDALQKSIRRSKRFSDEHKSPSPHKPAHARSHDNTERSPQKSAHAKSHAATDRSPSPIKPITVEKKRRRQTAAGGEEKTMRIALPFADTPIIKRNKEMRKSSADGMGRRSSSSMRGHRASDLIDGGRGNALPHAEVPTAEFFKHISADLTEPRRMRCLLGWCGSRALPPKPAAPKDGSKEAQAEFQALQAARVIQEELSQDLVSKGILSDWFSRDEEQPPREALTKKPNPRNIANAKKAEELERELERLKQERQEWENLARTAMPPMSPEQMQQHSDESQDQVSSLALSLIQPELLPSPQRAIFEQLQLHTDSTHASDLDSVKQRMQTISQNLEFSIDQFTHSVHAISTTKDVADRLADRSLSDAAKVLDERERAAVDSGKGKGKVDAVDALKGLARILNGRR